MQNFRVTYTYNKGPGAVRHGVKTIEATGAENARFRLSALRELRHVKGLRIISVLELE
jgi:hypothetical protein